MSAGHLPRGFWSSTHESATPGLGCGGHHVHATQRFLAAGRGETRVERGMSCERHAIDLGNPLV